MALAGGHILLTRMPDPIALLVACRYSALWYNWRVARFGIAINGEERAFEVTRQDNRLHIGGDAAADVRIVHRDGAYLILEVALAGEAPVRVRLAGQRERDMRRLWIDGRTLTAQRVRRGRTGHETGGGALASSIPAVVSQVLVAVGDRVSAGDKLILLESMKMVIPIQAPNDGRVTAIHCAAGDAVAAGITLLEIENEDE